MPNDGSFQIFTARFRERNPSGAVNAITLGCARYTHRHRGVSVSRARRSRLWMLRKRERERNERVGAIDRACLMNPLKLRGRWIS